MANSKSVSSTATARLKQDYMRLLRDPVPYCTAAPLPSNILEWHYVIKGPENSPYEGGYYHGKLVFPFDFPFKPPSILILTPNGRFKVNQKLCLSISDFHPDTWNPSWSISTILTGLLSFMVESTPTSGSIETSDSAKRRFALESRNYNIEDRQFCELFPDLATEIKEILKKEKEEANDAAQKASSPITTQTDLSIQQSNWKSTILGNMFVMLGLAAFAFVVKYVFNTIN